MEAVPRLPMLSFDLRTSVENVEFSSKLKQYIKNYYHEDPTLYASAITGIESMRREAVHPSKNFEGCSLLKRYFCQLYFMARRFPMYENGNASINFSWKCLHSNSVITVNDIGLEMISILYNIGALHTQLGAMDNRTTAEGMKMSCTHFQCAAFAFEKIIQDYPLCKNLGLSPVLMNFMHYLCLAQAQECILEKSMMDNRKSAITAKVAVQVVDYYKQCLKHLGEWPQDEKNSSEISSSKTFKKWDKYVKFKIAYYESISLLFQGQQSEDQQKMGERVAFYLAACEKLEDSIDISSGIDNLDNLNEALSFVLDVIEGKKKAAKNENEFIYHEEVPNISHLPKIKGASLVKGISFNVNDPEVSGPDLFCNIVPLRAHECSSLYSEEKAKLLRRINGLIETKDEELETFLSMLDLDEIKSKLDGNKLPQELIDKCAALNAKTDAIKNLTEAMSKLSDVYQDVEAMLNEIKELLKEEENHEKEYQEVVGKRPPSIAATDLTREAKKYQEAHTKASESNQTLHKAMVMHLSNLKLLSLPLKELVNHIPVITDNPEVEAVTNELRHLISKVDEMKQQRLMLAGQLRETVCQDDITKQVITYTGNNIADLFAEELKKYDKIVSLIEQNLAAQENILKAMKDAYARYGATRKNTGESHKRRASMISSLIASYDAYEDLISKSKKGLDFYKKLETNVSKLLQRVKGTCKVQDEEREEMMKSLKKPETSVSYPEAPPSNTLKLKDYLNLKKETGKLTLEHSNNIAPITSYYNDPTLPQQTWIPGVRPAPVGSEETESTLKGAADSFHGFYQGQGKDQVWSNAFYSVPQNADQKLKYYLQQNPNMYQGSTQNATCNSSQDMYPISSYSSTLPKGEGQIYEPKSNYYDIQNSPNRCYNPIQSFNEALNSQNTGNVSSYPTPEVAYIQVPSSGICSQNPVDVPSSFGYSQMSTAYTQNTASQPPFPSYTSTNDTSTGSFGSSLQNQKVGTQSQIPSAYNPAYPQTNSYSSSNPSQSPYNANSYDTYSHPSSTAYNNFATSQTPAAYNPLTSNPTPVSNYSDYALQYQTPVPPSYTNPSDQAQNFQNVQTYPQSTNTVAIDNQITNYMTTEQTGFNHMTDASSNYPTTNAYFPSQVPDVQMGSNTDAPQTSWQGSYNVTPNSQQYFQSGNESLYTASQTPNNYAMTNSEVYKTGEGSPSTYPADPNYENQYYTNQYGAYGGQAEVNYQNGNPVTYMQAGTDKQQAVTTTTFSNSEAKSSPATNPSNVDLLAGLDFNISHSPLLPEASVKKEESVLSRDETPVKTKSSTANLPASSPKLNLPKATSEEKEKVPPKDVMMNVENVTSFAQEVEKYEKFVEGLTLKTLNGPTSLDLKWKEITDIQEKISPRHIISVARCYPMKNRFPDILPYDDSRVELPSTKDDYINASKMMNLTELTPSFILTQSPLPSTYDDFWSMVFEQQVEVIVCLLSDSELDGHLYWPVEKGQELETKKLKISLQSSNVRSHWVERILSICVTETRTTRVVVHLQFTAWPGSSFPESPGPFLTFTSECINFFNQQRSYNHPVVVHCMSGVGRTGLFCLIIACLLDIQAGKGIPDLAILSGRMCQFRKNCLRDREHLKFAYQAVLYYCQDFLMKRGILTSRSTFEDKKSKDGKCHTRHPSEDFLVSSSSEMTQLQAGVEHLEIDSPAKKPESETNIMKEGGPAGISIVKSDKNSSLNPDILSTLNVENFSLKLAETEKKKRQFLPENFNSGSTMNTSSSPSDDPLSKLDPLWTMKK